MILALRTDDQSSEPRPERPAPCFHGGAFFEAIGDEFDCLERRDRVINADVLDAWFPPAPGVTAALREHLPWLVRTSPPAGCEGLLRMIGRLRGLDARCLVPGAGSSDLIFRVLRHWLNPASRVLILDPTYGEYAHVLERVVGCSVPRLHLTREIGYRPDLDQLAETMRAGYDLVVLVNPNSPTGQHVRREDLQPILQRIPEGTRVWVDETYVEYAGTDQSLETFAQRAENVVVCKSMSKVYALSGARVAYLCAALRTAAELRAITPPWCIGLPAQVAAVRALQAGAYYAGRYAETRRLRAQLAAALSALRLDVIPGVANFLLCHLPAHGPDAASVVKDCRRHGRRTRSTCAGKATDCGRRPSNWSQARIVTASWWTGNGGTTPNAPCLCRTHSGAATPCGKSRKRKARGHCQRADYENQDRGLVAESAPIACRTAVKQVCAFRPRQRASDGPSLGLRSGPRHDCGLDDHRAAVSFQRHLATGHQYRHHDYHIPHGLSYSEHPESRQRSDATEAGRIAPRHRGRA
jgi:histidinol-phosphate/aromatic aminotransferase/cobyric acid decarboxylase-like protein